jgi:uncharacterized protein YndB with AHSA1/START domain
MVAIVKEFTVEVSPRRVWAALTNEGEITRWWSNEAHFTPEVGTLAEFRFRPPAGTLQFEVVELEQGRRMHWMSRKGPPYWAGTSVTWQLEPVQSGTHVVFTHDRFPQVDEAYERIRENWRYFLDSLKSYLETGKGTPGTPPNVK